MAERRYDGEQVPLPDAEQPAVTFTHRLTAGSDIDIAARLNASLPAIGGTVALSGILVLISWLLHFPGLNRLHPVLGQMGFRTAFCFVLAGTGLLLLRTEHTRGWKLRLAQASATVAVLVSALALSELYGWDVGIDQFFQGAVAQGFRTRMPMATALGFSESDSLCCSSRLTWGATDPQRSSVLLPR